MQTILTYNITNPFLLVFISFILGIVMIFINNKNLNCTKNMMGALLILPALVCSALLAVNGNLGTSIAILGVFSLVRFRSMPGTAKDIVSVFFAMVIGFITSTGYIGIAIGLTLILSVMNFVVTIFIEKKQEYYQLKILVPETMNFDEIFDEILIKYFDNVELFKVKSSNMGTLFELNYKVLPKNNINKKDFFDEIRNCNGNLNISYFKFENDNL